MFVETHLEMSVAFCSSVNTCSVDVANDHFLISMSRTGGSEKPMSGNSGWEHFPWALLLRSQVQESVDYEPGIRLSCVDTQDSRHLILVVMYNEIRQEVQQPPGRSSNPFTLGE